MDREREYQKMKAETFRINNGKVLRYINLMREKNSRLDSLKSCMGKDGITNREFLDCINFLQKEGYVELRKISNQKIVTLSDEDYEKLEGQLTGKGIRLLMGNIEDTAIDV